MTIFDSDGSRRENLETLPDFVQYLAYGDEETKEGKKHYQCFLYTKKVRTSAFTPWVGKAYRAPMKGTFKDNEEYCSKQGKLKEFGDRPDQGARKDLLNCKRKLEEKICDVYEVAEDEEYFATIAKHSRFMKEYTNSYHGRRAAKNDLPEVTFIMGAPGSGKTRSVHQLEDELYDCSAEDNYKWKDGYNLHEAVLYDNVEPGGFNRARILKEMDRYKIQVPVKGGFVWWKPKRIYITSTFTMDEIAAQFSDPKEFTRRVTVYKWINN